MSVRRCQEEVDSAEFVEWCAYRRVSPWGPERADWRAAKIAHTVRTSMCGSKGTKFRDFMFPLEENKDTGQQHPADQKLRLDMWAQSMNREVKKKV